MHGYWGEFLSVALAHLLAVASPGPDFAIVLKQSLSHGRRAAIWTSIGVGSAILLHVGYSLLGLGLVVRNSPTWFAIVKYLGAAYIAWLGIQSLRSKPRTGAHEPAMTSGPAGSNTRSEAALITSPRAAFATGFVTNALNPKVTLFFISLFVLFVSPATPKWIQAGYGLWMSLATMAWFSLVATLFTRDAVRRRFLHYGHWIDRVLGVVFLVFAGILLVATVE